MSFWSKKKEPQDALIECELSKLRLTVLAHLNRKQEFMAQYKQGDEKLLYNGETLVYSALRNTDLESRYGLCNYLLDMGCPIQGETCNKASVFHILFGHARHDVEQDVRLCRRFIELGVNPNQLDEKHILAVQWLINYKLTDEEMKPLYELWFSQVGLDLITPNWKGISPLELARKLPYRAHLVARMEQYLA